MTALVWDRPDERTYESGLDRGVLYFPDGGGVAWNGLISIEERTSKTVTPVHFDGTKINDIVTYGDFSGVMKAYTYPEEFLRFDGVLEDEDGVFLTNQPHEKFHLSYRTGVGDGLEGLDLGYKIHLLYNLTAVPSQRVYNTLSLNSQPVDFQWTLNGIPEEFSGYRPTSHVIIDSRKLDPHLMQDIEDILYGDESRSPMLPSLKSLTSFIRKWERIIIIDNNDGTWTAESPIDGYIVMIDETTFQINNANAVYLDIDTYEISSTEKNEEDV